jgi:hypothetical protein
LLSRWCCHAGDFTDEILVAVGDRSGAERASRLAGMIACRHRGAVSLVGAPGRSLDARPGLAASEGILHAMGTPPHVLARPTSVHSTTAECIVPAAAAKLGASLLVICAGDDQWDAPLVHVIARRAGCSILAIPDPAATRAGRSRRGA